MNLNILCHFQKLLQIRAPYGFACSFRYCPCKKKGAGRRCLDLKQSPGFFEDQIDGAAAFCRKIRACCGSPARAGILPEKRIRAGHINERCKLYV